MVWFSLWGKFSHCICASGLKWIYVVSCKLSHSTSKSPNLKQQHKEPLSQDYRWPASATWKGEIRDMARALPDTEGPCEEIFPNVTFLPPSFAFMVCLPSGVKHPKWRVTFLRTQGPPRITQKASGMWQEIWFLVGPSAGQRMKHCHLALPFSFYTMNL